MATFKAILKDWVNEGFDPFAAPEETGSAFGTKHGDNIAAIERTRIATKRMPGIEGDSPLRDDLPVNRQFADVEQDEPEIHAEPGFENDAARVQPLQVSVALGRDVESVGHLRVPAKPVLPDH